MGLEGLGNYRKSKAGGDQLRLKDGQKVKIYPLQELDADAENFNAKAGLAVFTTEFANPLSFTNRVVDTTNTEGRCVGREQLNKFGWYGDENGGDGSDKFIWRPKDFMYLNVLVDFEDGEEPKVMYVKWNMAPKAVEANVLIESHENNGTVDGWWAYSREGSGRTDTNYKLSALKANAKTRKVNVEDYELIDLDAKAPNVPYDRQKEALGIEDDPRELVGAGVSSGSDSSAPVDDIDKAW